MAPPDRSLDPPRRQATRSGGGGTSPGPARQEAQEEAQEEARQEAQEHRSRAAPPAGPPSARWQIAGNRTPPPPPWSPRQLPPSWTTGDAQHGSLPPAVARTLAAARAVS